jgi:hypothetical protein
VLTLFAGLVGVASNAVTLLPNSEYAKETIRGGSELGVLLLLITKKGSTGLNEDYALVIASVSSEPFVMMVPRMFGGSSGRPEIKQEESKAVQALQSMPQELGNQLVRNLSYIGVDVDPRTPATICWCIVCFLAILVL